MTSANLYGFFRFFSGVCRQTLINVGVVWSVENVATKHRVDVAFVIFLAYVVGSSMVRIISLVMELFRTTWSRSFKDFTA